jgi:hypothetical protein
LRTGTLLEEVSCGLLAAAKYQVVIDLTHTLDLMTLLASLLSLLVLLAHFMILSLNALLESLVVLLAPLDDLAHPFPLGHEREVLFEAILRTDCNAEVLELLLHHLL